MAHRPLCRVEAPGGIRSPSNALDPQVATRQGRVLERVHEQERAVGGQGTGKAAVGRVAAAADRAFLRPG